MRVLVLGGDGMLGHELADTLAAEHEVAATVRGPAGTERPERVFGGIDARCQDDMAALLDRFRPDAVVNAIGLERRRPEGQRALPAVEVNTVFPHRLARLCRVADIRLVHIGTAWVFSGRRGRYTEDDQPDPADVHGMSKLLGEVREPPALTLRTSIIGLELAGRAGGLVEGFLAGRGQVPGNRRAIWAPLTTRELSGLVGRVLTKHEELTGLWHVATPTAVAEYDLLARLADRLRRAGRAVAEVVAADGPARDHSLLADRFTDATGYTAPGWEAMLDDLVEQVMARDGRGRRDG